MERIKKSLQLAGQERSGVSEVVDFAEAAESFERPPRGGEELDAHTRVIDVPASVLERTRVVTGRSQSLATHAYKLLRTQVLQRMLAQGWQTLAVVSPGAGEGKTLTAINLAISLGSTRSHTALLVDLDWRRPAVHTYFEYTPIHDVYDYLRGERSLAEVFVSPGLARFSFLPCRQPVPDASEHLGSLGGFVRELKSRYTNRIVLFDLPPLLATDDALSFLPLVDCVLLVVEEGRSKRDDVVRSAELIGQERLLGTVINKSWHKLANY